MENTFKIVDIPVEDFTSYYRQLILRLKENLGKGIEVSTTEKAANAYRTSLRATMARTGMNKEFSLHTKEDVVANTLIVWLTTKS